MGQKLETRLVVNYLVTLLLSGFEHLDTVVLEGFWLHHNWFRQYQGSILEVKHSYYPGHIIWNILAPNVRQYIGFTLKKIYELHTLRTLAEEKNMAFKIIFTICERSLRCCEVINEVLHLNMGASIEDRDIWKDYIWFYHLPFSDCYPLIISSVLLLTIF